MTKFLISLFCFLLVLILFFPYMQMINRNNFKNLINLLKGKNKAKQQKEYKFKRVFILGEKIFKFFRINLNFNLKKDINAKLLIANLKDKITVEGFFGTKITLVLLSIIYAGIIILYKTEISTLALFLFAPIIAYFLPDYFVTVIIKRRQWKIQVELPNILNTLAIITDSGLSFNEAIKKLCETRQGELVEEFHKYEEEVNLGFIKEDALMRLVDRCQINELSIFVSNLIQSIEKGSAGMTKVLKAQAKEIWDNRLLNAKELGEKASMKLFFPMIVLVFPCLLIFLIGPAIFSIIKNFSR